MNWEIQLSESIKRFIPLGERKTADGTRFIGHVPHYAPAGFMFVLFPPLKPEQLSMVRKTTRLELPEQLRSFYTQYNGMHLFQDEISFSGLRLEAQVWQPFDFVVRNVEERPKDADSDAFFFASHRKDGTIFYTRHSTPEIVRCTRESAEPVQQWSDFDSMMVSEIGRFNSVFDNCGKGLAR